MKLTADNKKLLWIIIIALLSLIFYANAFAKGMGVLHEKTFNVNPGETLWLDSDCGDVNLSTWDKDELYVKIYGNSRTEEYIEFSFEQKSDGVEIIADKHGSFFNWFSSINLKYEIIVPSRFNVDLSTAGGDLVIKDLEGKMMFKTSGGDVELSSTIGELTAKTSGGDINLTNQKGNCEVKTSGGDIRCIDTKGDLYASTSGGNITLKAVDGQIDASTSGGSVSLDYTGPNKGVELTSSGGDIEVRLPSNFKADAELKTSGGDIECDYSMSRTYKVKSYYLEAEFNGGGNKLYCRTSGGDVIVKEK